MPWGWLIVLTIACALPGIAIAQSKIAQPGESDYVLELTPFARHTGSNAMDLTYPPDGSGRVFLSTQSGQVFGFDSKGRSLGVFLDIAKERPQFTRTDGAFNGLMYIAFHPDYARQGSPGEGRFYAGHQVRVSEARADFDSKDFGAMGDSDVRFVIAEWRVDPDNPDRIDPASYRQVLLLNFHTYANNPHAVGELAFNPYAQLGDADYGKLYLAVGDSNNGNYGLPTNLNRTQKPDNPYAKILRIDPLQHRGKPYRIPGDNPFGTEVYAIGIRSAQSFSFAKDLEGKPVLVAFDVGALSVEEINIVRGGDNFGWDRFEGTLDFDTKRTIQGTAKPPVVQYGHAFPTRLGDPPSGGGAAIIGGLVVSDPDDPSFQGQILFGDLPRGTLMHANYHHALTVEKQGKQSKPYIISVRLGDQVGNFADVVGAKRGDTRFGVDESGSVYIVSKQTQTIFKTKLVYTGLPVKSETRIASGNQGFDWALAVIAAVTVSLIVLLLFVIKQNKPGQSAASARVED